MIVCETKIRRHLYGTSESPQSNSLVCLEGRWRMLDFCSKVEKWEDQLAISIAWQEVSDKLLFFFARLLHAKPKHASGKAASREKRGRKPEKKK